MSRDHIALVFAFALLLIFLGRCLDACVDTPQDCREMCGAPPAEFREANWPNHPTASCVCRQVSP